MARRTPALAAATAAGMPGPIAHADDGSRDGDGDAPHPRPGLMDRGIVEQVYRARSRDLVRQLRRQYPQHASRAEDAVQHAFLKLTSQEQHVVDPGGWAARVANNYMLDVHRRERRFSTTEEFDPGSLPALPAAAWSEEEERERRLAMMRDALAGMGEPGRSLLELKYLRGYDYQQIAEALQLSPGSIGTMLLRARRRLHGLMTNSTTARAEALE